MDMIHDPVFYTRFYIISCPLDFSCLDGQDSMIFNLISLSLFNICIFSPLFIQFSLLYFIILFHSFSSFNFSLSTFFFLISFHSFLLIFISLFLYWSYFFFPLLLLWHKTRNFIDASLFGFSLYSSNFYFFLNFFVWYFHALL